MMRSILRSTRLFSAAVTTMRSFEANSSAALSLPRVSSEGLRRDSTVSTSVLLMSGGDEDVGLGVDIVQMRFDEDNAGKYGSCRGYGEGGDDRRTYTASPRGPQTPHLARVEWFRPWLPQRLEAR